MTGAGTLAVQLYSVREQLAANRDATLSRLAGIGFRHVELFGIGSPERDFADRRSDAATLRRRLDAHGLTVIAAHAAVQEGHDNVEKLAEECAILGTDLAIVAHPRLVPGHDIDTFADTDRVDAFADTLSVLAHEAARHRLRLGYHNHWFEWARLPDGGSGWERFWSRAAAEILAEVDLYWAAAARADPRAVLAELGERVCSVHIKDGPAEPDGSQTPLGTGRLDPIAILRDGKEIPWHITEIDTTELDPYRLLATNAELLTRHDLSSW